MSFLGILNWFHKANNVVAVGIADVAPFAPILESIPGFGPVFQVAFQGITFAEQLLTGNGNGPAKKVLALAVVNAVHPGLDQAKLGGVIDGIVQGLNKLSAAGADPVLAPAK
jgi:hypothetical protein